MTQKGRSPSHSYLPDLNDIRLSFYIINQNTLPSEDSVDLVLSHEPTNCISIYKHIYFLVIEIMTHFKNSIEHTFKSVAVDNIPIV